MKINLFFLFLSDSLCFFLHFLPMILYFYVPFLLNKSVLLQFPCLFLVPHIRNKTLYHVQTRVQLRTRCHLLLVSCHHLIIEHLHELLLHINCLVVNHLVLIQIDNQLSQYFLVPFKAYTLILTNSCFQLKSEIFFLELLHKHLT